MTTSQSPLRVLKTQADKIAATLKAAERGEKIDVGFAEKIADARAKDNIKLAIFMDDKIVTIEITWTTINTTNEAGLAEYILKQMRGSRDAVH